MRPTSERRRSLVPLALALPLAGASLLGSCSSSKSDRGQLILTVQADMKIPDDVDEVRIEILARGRQLLSNSYALDDKERRVKIPATLAILGGADPSTPVTVRVISRQGAVLRTLRQVVTTVPERRLATLRMPIQWLCDGQAVEPEPGQVDTTCPDGQSCVSGRCVEDEVDSDDLPDFTPEDVYGGGTGEGDGSCLDTVGCFAGGTGVTLDEACTFAAPDTEALNVAMVLEPGGDGICGPEACLVPLDADEETGWFEKDGRVVLPPAVCTKLADGKIAGVATTNACPTKTASVPTCGPWSAVTEQAASFDASAPTNIPGGCSPPSDGTLSAVCITLAPEEIELTADAELDGTGTLVVQAFDTPDFENATPVATEELGEFSVGSLPRVRLEGLPGTTYLFAALWDNPDETSIASLRRGGGWLGGVDADIAGLRTLAAWQLEAGKGQAITLPMQALRRLRVTARLAADATLSDDGSGYLQWLAYGTDTPAVDGAVVGASEPGDCSDLAAGPALIEGFVFGPGPHHLVATLDDFGLSQGTLALPGSLQGSVLSGSPGAAGTWSASETVTFPATKYVTTALVEVGHTVPVTDQPPPKSFQCASSACGDGVPNGAETDVDCGGNCSPCADGRTCAGPADCQSRVCVASLCQAPTCNDGVQNGLETDSDCGGGTCGPCLATQGCLQDSDCAGGGTCVVNVCEGGTAPSDAGAPVRADAGLP